MDMNKAKMINDAVTATAVRVAREEAKAEKIEIALNFLKIGLSVEQIADGTGLTVEQIKELQNS